MGLMGFEIDRWKSVYMDIYGYMHWPTREKTKERCEPLVVPLLMVVFACI